MSAAGTTRVVSRRVASASTKRGAPTLGSRLAKVRVEFDRINHILIPKTKEDRERLRRSWIARALRPIADVYFAFTEEGRFTFIVALVAGGFGLDVRRTDVHLLWAVLSASLLAALLATRAYRLRGVRAELLVPRRATRGESMTFTLVLTNDGDRPHRGLRIRGPFLPWDGRWSTARPTVPELLPGRTERAFVKAIFSQRGHHHLDPFRASAVVPLGLTFGPPLSTTPTSFLVVPKVANVTRLALPVGRRHQPGGVALASRTGESMDLLGVRPYRPGDPARDLHARGWARTGQPVVREYQEEYFSRVGVVVDKARSEEAPERFEAVLSMAAGVVANLSRGEALIDLLIVGDRIHTLTIGRSLGFLDQALDLLACVEAGPAPTADELWASLAEHAPRLSCVVLVTAVWDAERRALADRIRQSGPGCRTILVASSAEPSVGDRDLVRVLGEAVARGEALSL